MNSKRFYRSETDRNIAGVCGGIAAYFGVDSSLVRLLFVLGTVLGGNGILLYVILWMVLPEESDVYIENLKRKNDEFVDEP